MRLNPADLQAAAEAGALKPNGDTWQNSSYPFAAGGAVSTAYDLAIWMRALAGGKLFDAEHQRQWFDSLESQQDPSNPLGQKYGYGISEVVFGRTACISTAVRCPATTRSGLRSHQ